jgi:hypothetical protein
VPAIKSVMRKTNTAMMTQLRAALLVVASAAAVVTLPGCGGSNPGNPNPVPTPTVSPSPTPPPTPPSQSAACTLTHPTKDCNTVNRHPQMNADLLQRAIDTATATPGAMYPGGSRINDLMLFRNKTIEVLANAGYCAAWDYGNTIGDEIYTRTPEGCVAEQYDIITGEGGLRAANKKSNAWQDFGFANPVPGPKPNFSKVGDTQCSLPGDRSTYCFSIKRTPGAFGPQIYALLVQVMNENPALFDPNDFAPGQGTFIPSDLRPAAWRIRNVDGFIAALEAKIRANGFCGYVEKGDILKVKSVSMGNIFHEEIDVVQNPDSGGDYVSFVVKDRCHDAGF